MRKKKTWCLVLLLVPFLCTSCQLMPVEEELPAAPVIRAYEGAAYRQVTVTRGDLILTKAVRCTCVPTRRESLGFSQGGVNIERVYVSEGQQVQAGELMAELSMGDLKEQILAGEREMQILQLKKEHLLEQQALEEHWQELSKEDKQAALEQQLGEVADALYIQELRLEEMRAEQKERQICASIDGTVSYVQKLKRGQRSVKGETILTISDKSTTVFVVEGADTQYFPVGTPAIIRCQDLELSAGAVEAASLGLPDQREDGTPLVYLRLTEPEPSLRDGAEGSIRITLETRSQVLFVNKRTIKTANGEQFVYMQGEDGRKVRRTVTTGLESGDLVEITSGLAEGESVIVE